MITKEACFGMYIGQRIQTSSNTIWELRAGMLSKVIEMNCKLILRPFESMTGEEKGKVVNMIGADHIREINNLLEYYDGSEDDLIIKLYCAYMPSIVEHLISIGIDVFNLRERGWAVYESDLEGENNENN